MKHPFYTSERRQSWFLIFIVYKALLFTTIWWNLETNILSSFFVAPVLASEKSLPMKFLLESVKHLEVEQVPKFLKSVLKSLVEIKGHQKVDEMWTRSGLSISQLLPSNKLDKLPEIIKDTVWIILASLEFYWKKTLSILIPYLLIKFPQQKKNQFIK